MKRIVSILSLCLLLLCCSKTKQMEPLIPSVSTEQSETNSNIFVRDSTATISLKGIELGQVYNGETTLFTSVGDKEGVISVSLLEDKRVFKIAFMSNKVLSTYDIASFRKNIENNYHIQLKENAVYKNHFYNYSENLYFSYIENSIENDSYSISFSITDKNLFKLNDLKESDDF